MYSENKKHLVNQPQFMKFENNSRLSKINPFITYFS